MKRRELLQTTAAFGLLAATPFSLRFARAAGKAPGATPNVLKPPAHGKIPVAFLLSDGAVVIDFAGPWEVFQDTMVPDRGPTMDDQMPFKLYTVAETDKPIRASGGMKIVPDYDFATAPEPKILVIPAQGGQGEPTLEWIRKSSKSTDVTMSVCTGAFLLAGTGLMSGKSATTHHGSYGIFAMDHPDIRLVRGARFVENGNIASAGGLSSGIDLALRIVERYFGREIAQETATQMEYQGRGWLNADSNAFFAKPPASTDAHPVCPVCWMKVDAKTAPKSVYRGKSYYFCMPGHKTRFDTAPAMFLG